MSSDLVNQSPERTEVAAFIRDYLVRRHAADEDAVEARTFNELYVDSLGIVQLGMKVKKRFGVEFAANEITGADSVGSVIDAVHSRALTGEVRA
ncbi:MULTISPECIES: acyl carrier protein [Tsukamurella]|uniref:Acyl carrier protein n=1 Tax=Tsukamurella strandjordii TaxID=147577 RepID=A0AA90ND41_9ACTN|nr:MULTISPECIES: acyl carrier protein [Tsukamurella]MDP0396988.1 acyl carrier protein [Tsukamurella strandjordii]GIZ96790.1 hypothetical protein TTY48_14020 [Tsukamurella sp. TY48]